MDVREPATGGGLVEDETMVVVPAETELNGEETDYNDAENLVWKTLVLGGEGGVRKEMNCMPMEACTPRAMDARTAMMEKIWTP
jgi:hypothetical protein